MHEASPPHQLQWGELFAPTADALLPVSSQPPRRLEVPQSKKRCRSVVGRDDTCAQPTSAAFTTACFYSVAEGAIQWYAPYFFGTWRPRHLNSTNNHQILTRAHRVSRFGQTRQPSFYS
jgi:hypothetical protein